MGDHTDVNTHQPATAPAVREDLYLPFTMANPQVSGRIHRRSPQHQPLKPISTLLVRVLHPHWPKIHGTCPAACPASKATPRSVQTFGWLREWWGKQQPAGHIHRLLVVSTWLLLWICQLMSVGETTTKWNIPISATITLLVVSSWLLLRIWVCCKIG